MISGKGHLMMKWSRELGGDLNLDTAACLAGTYLDPLGLSHLSVLIHILIFLFFIPFYI